MHGEYAGAWSGINALGERKSEMGEEIFTPTLPGQARGYFRFLENDKNLLRLRDILSIAYGEAVAIDGFKNA